jgi:hypothetical protein
MAHALMHARWETAERWYEVEVLYDLLGDWVVMRRWGGKGSDRYCKRTVLISNESEGQRIIEKVDKVRRSRKTPYCRVY